MRRHVSLPFWKTAAGVAAGALLSASLMGSSANAASTRSGPLDAPAPGPVVDGRILLLAHAVAGAKVTLFALPDQAVLSDERKGGRVPVTPVGSAFSSTTGRYSVTPTDLSALEADANTNGIVNFYVFAEYQGHASTFFFSRRLVSTRRGIVLAAENEGTKLQLSAQLANISLTKVAEPRNPDCGTPALEATWAKKVVLLGDEQSQVDSVVMEFSYANGSESSLGVGVQATGSSGWQESGSLTISGGSTATQNFPRENKAGGYNRDSYFSYSEYFVQCLGLETWTTSWDGGDTTGSVGFLSAGFCVPEPATPDEDPTFDLDSTTASTWNNGVDINADIGINLSAQTGYSTDTNEGYWFTDTAHLRYLCGRNNYPASTSPGPGYLLASDSDG